MRTFFLPARRGDLHGAVARAAGTPGQDVRPDIREALGAALRPLGEVGLPANHLLRKVLGPERLVFEPSLSTSNAAALTECFRGMAPQTVELLVHGASHVATRVGSTIYDFAPVWGAPELLERKVRPLGSVRDAQGLLRLLHGGVGAWAVGFTLALPVARVNALRRAFEAAQSPVRYDASTRNGESCVSYPTGLLEQFAPELNISKALDPERFLHELAQRPDVLLTTFYAASPKQSVVSRTSPAALRAQSLEPQMMDAWLAGPGDRAKGGVSPALNLTALRSVLAGSERQQLVSLYADESVALAEVGGLSGGEGSRKRAEHLGHAHGLSEEGIAHELRRKVDLLFSRWGEQGREPLARYYEALATRQRARGIDVGGPDAAKPDGAAHRAHALGASLDDVRLEVHRRLDAAVRGARGPGPHPSGRHSFAQWYAQESVALASLRGLSGAETSRDFEATYQWALGQEPDTLADELKRKATKAFAASLDRQWQSRHQLLGWLSLQTYGPEGGQGPTSDFGDDIADYYADLAMRQLDQGVDVLRGGTVAASLSCRDPHRAMGAQCEMTALLAEVERRIDAARHSLAPDEPWPDKLRIMTKLGEGSAYHVYLVRDDRAPRSPGQADASLRVLRIVKERSSQRFAPHLDADGRQALAVQFIEAAERLRADGDFQARFGDILPSGLENPAPGVVLQDEARGLEYEALSAEAQRTACSECEAIGEAGEEILGLPCTKLPHEFRFRPDGTVVAWLDPLVDRGEVKGRMEALTQ